MKLGAFIVPGRHLAEAVDLARRAESLEYESAWVTHGLGRDSFIVLAAYATATSRLRVGNGVVPIYPRHPVAMAQAALSLAELSGGRFSLGIGISHAPMVESMLGLPLTKPLAVMREYVAVVRGALGEGASFTGTHYRVQWAMAIPERPAPPPLYLAGLSTPMLELAGEVADGAVLWLTPPVYVKDVAVPALARGRLRAGKTLEDFEIVCAVPLAITDDTRAATTAFKAELTRYLRLPFYRRMLEASGHGADLKAFDTDGEVTDALARALGVVGTARDGRAFIRAYRDAGVTLPAVRPITFPDAPWYRPTLETMAGC
ncbi:MAG TPA: LLM class flavin-dependent oxidoreductase [Methylomirabilota bacterium]|jgi:alkanesulfonate monooxygenase SsuD/methylene tetrahydromethanopterin reductase-like flavin-dependent oxidoreductase (luciferase family)